MIGRVVVQPTSLLRVLWLANHLRIKQLYVKAAEQAADQLTNETAFTFLEEASQLHLGVCN